MSASDVKLGSLAPSSARRDAIHIAIAPVVAATDLSPGDHVGFLEDRRMGTSANKRIGIVDPFLTSGVKEGERFWLCLYQQTITGMRHHWFHPSFDDTDISLHPSEQWIHDYAASVGLTYQRLMEGAAAWIKDREYICEGGLLEGIRVPDEFWTHYEAVTGKKGEGSFFTCSC